MKRYGMLLLVALLLTALAGCGKKEAMKDGYFTAQADSYSHGWKEFVTITVKNGKIIAVEYNAENESGFIKSWDNAYMKNMKTVNGTYPNEYTRNYAGQLLKNQSSGAIDAISGASTSWNSFRILAEAAIQQAYKGDSRLITVKTD